MSNISLFCKKEEVEKDLAKLKGMDQYDFATIDSLIELLEEVRLYIKELQNLRKTLNHNCNLFLRLTKGFLRIEP